MHSLLAAERALGGRQPAFERGVYRHRRPQRFCQALIASFSDMMRVLAVKIFDMQGDPGILREGLEPLAEQLGDMDTELFREWFQAFAQNASITLHVENLYGENSHHIAETCYKGLAKALRAAMAIDAALEGRLPTTKGTLGG